MRITGKKKWPLNFRRFLVKEKKKTNKPKRATSIVACASESSRDPIVRGPQYLSPFSPAPERKKTRLRRRSLARNPTRRVSTATRATIEVHTYYHVLSGGSFFYFYFFLGGGA